MIKKLLSLFTRREKKRGAIVLMMAIGMAVLETAGVASVMPFLSVLGDPGIVETNPVLATAYDFGGFASVDAFLMALGVGAFALIVTSAIFRAVTLYAITRWSMMRMHSLSERLLETYLRQPYAYFLDRHSGDMSKSILTETQQLQGQVIRPALNVLAHGTVLLAIVILLVAIDPVLATAVAALIGGAYALIYVGIRRFLGRIGQDRVRANAERFTAAGEALGGIKDVKLLGREHAYLSRFRGPSTRFAKHQAASQVLGQVPKFLIEAIGFGGIIVLTLVLMAANGGVSGGGLGGVLPVLGLYAFAGYRMLPAAQQVYQGIAQLRFGSAAVDTVYDDLHRRASLAEIHKTAPAPMQPEREIALGQVTYHYPRSAQPALVDINLTIPVGSSVGLVGSTGAGKTTLVDVILGLLRPTEGAITVDGEPVTDGNLRAWQAALGYVPQDIFLTDATVTENIAFGIDPERINAEQVERCARMAQVHEFVTNEMPQGYNTIVGERGVRLSGGQRQRIGIARALYHDPDILVFDEATSALDTVTERAVMEAIDALHHQKTIILIAHRLSTVAGCDQVVLLDQGRVEASGEFDALRAANQRFRRMAVGKG
ncbi:ABC transporter ATP-binding protein [Spiribacter salinus]|uniref:ABC transporter ATP-binding protein n=1 Tax=Spiribacter salinus TaxID=1335746 RepID=UPI0021BC01A7|nr:ABC transporter ATP-binding protein [Spiribacter salinus]MBY5269433.1 ABC transporter ATP-binding protein [Spiribacter salinus]